MGKFKFVKLKKNHLYLQSGAFEILSELEGHYIVKVPKLESYTLLKPYPHSRFNETEETKDED